MKNVIVKSTASINLTADDWQLYDLPGRDAVASELNKALEEFIAANPTKDSAYKNMGKFEKEMWKHSKFGAADSEGYHTFEDVLDEVYGIKF